jgi:ribose transport system substrate-binding protein
MRYDGIRKAVLASFILTLTAVGVSCSIMKEAVPEGANREEKKNVALVLGMRHGDYWKTVYSGAETAAREYGVNLSFLAPDDEEDVKGQVNQVAQALEDGADALILAPNDDVALAGAVNEAALKVPVIALDSNVNSSKLKSYIGTDNYEAGRKAAEELIRLMEGKSSRIGIMGFVQGTQKAEMREKGLLDTLAKHPEIAIVEKEYSFSDQKLATQLTQAMIDTHGRLDAIVALNSIATLGVAEGLEKLGLKGSVKLIAFDSTVQELELMQEGIIHATVIQNPFSMGYLGVRHAVEAMAGDKVPAVVDTGSKVVRQEDMFTPENQKLLFPLLK